MDDVREVDDIPVSPTRRRKARAKKNGSKVRDLLFHTQDLSIFQDLDIFNNNLGLNDDWYFPSEPSIQIYTGDLGFNNMPTASSITNLPNGDPSGVEQTLSKLPTDREAVDECEPEMLLAMCALGAESRQENRKAAFLFHAAKEILHQRASRKEWKDTEGPIDASGRSASSPSQQTSTRDSLRYRRTMREARCAFLLIAFATWQREESIHREAFNLQSLLARCVRECQLKETEQSLFADAGGWHLWIQQEIDRRVKLLSFAFLNLQSIAFGTPPDILADEINVRLPCSSLEWIAPNEQKWRLARRPGHREQMSFQDALCHVIKNTPETNSTNTLPIPSPLSNYIILHAIIQRILLAYHTLGPYNDANNIILNGQKNVMRNSLHAWTSLWQRAPESSLDPRNPNGPVTYTSTALLGVAILQSHDATDIAKRLLLIPRLPPGPHLLPAILHATHALSIPVKLGVNFVARSHAFVWSVQHSLCGLEFAIFLSKWLFCIADSQTRRPLNAHEARLVNWISDIVEEGRTSADDDLWSRPSNLSDCSYLGIAVVKLWARLIRGNGHWSLFEVVSDGLDLYANTCEQSFLQIQGMGPDHATDTQVLVKWSREQDSATRNSAPNKASKVTPRIVRMTSGDNPMETGPSLRVPSIISKIPSHAHDILVVERYGTNIDCISPPLLLFGVRQPAWSTNQTQSLVEEAVAYP
ncbi:C2H2 transcription factor [Aspergillus neoniger CBS 115656]|uniref:C2H2 transcription factor n=1 Tax=Aspergillus neoniger (strain CBS 115656) TaxID=1448310 RepID=A0A318YLN4_ASPNB|nr:C2H2 transcription factor [Aspergillus neoniger CBS 115656]PYH35116.1 C2H2 transcription factor [Aspergillus neoniger CBS 115656]